MFRPSQTRLFAPMPGVAAITIFFLSFACANRSNSDLGAGGAAQMAGRGGANGGDRAGANGGDQGGGVSGGAPGGATAGGSEGIAGASGGQVAGAAGQTAGSGGLPSGGIGGQPSGGSAGSMPGNNGGGGRFADDPGVFVEGAKMSFISNSYMGEWGGVQKYLGLTLLASSIGLEPEMVPAREEAGGWYWGMGLGSMTSALDRIEREGDYDTCVFLNGGLSSMRTFATRLTAACKQVVLFVAGGGKNPRSLGNGLRQSVAGSLENARTIEAEFPNVLVVPAALIYYDLAVNPPVDVPRIDYLYGFDNIHQNGLGTLINAWAMYAVMSGLSPVGIGFDYDSRAPGSQRFMRGTTIGLSRPNPWETPGDELPFTDDVRDLFQARILKHVQAWQAGTTEFD